MLDQSELHEDVPPINLGGWLNICLWVHVVGGKIASGQEYLALCFRLLFNFQLKALIGHEYHYLTVTIGGVD